MAYDPVTYDARALLAKIATNLGVTLTVDDTYWDERNVLQAIADTSANFSRLRPAWYPSDHGYLAWTYDPALCTASQILATGGTLNVARLKLTTDASITGVVLYVATQGTNLVANQCLAAVYQGTTLLGTTADQSGVWNTTGVKASAISGGPVAATAGDIFVAWYANTNAGNLPTFGRAANTAVANAGLSAANSRFATADASLTTTMPPTLGTLTALGVAYWAAIY